MQYQFIEHIDAQEHDAFVSRHELCNLLQSSSWGLVKENWKHEIAGVKVDGTLVASCMILIKPLPLGFSMFYIPRGPVMDYTDASLVAFLMKELKHFGRKHRCLFITFDPAVHCNDYTLQKANENHYPQIDTMIQLLQDNGAIFKGFTKKLDETIQPRYHANVYACEDFENTLTKSCKKALATVKKKMIEVDAYHVDGVEDFAKVMHCTEERKNIHLRDQTYFQRLMEVYGEDAVIFLAKLPLRRLYEDTCQRYEQNQKDLEVCPENAKKKRFTLEELHASLSREVKELKENLDRDGDVAVVSGALCVKFGATAEILYAGMDDRYRRYMAPYASFYHCMVWSFEKGCKWSNMGGIEGALKGGLTQFKANFNPTINEFVGEFDLPVYTSLYALSQWAMKQRKKALQKR